jgi:aminoglycoside 6'-N-acetyltransferase I
VFRPNEDKQEESNMVDRIRQFCTISESEEWMSQAAHLLIGTFRELENYAWSDDESARKEVVECIQDPNVCIGLCEGNTLLGWIGLRPMYKTTWEMHPLVVDPQHQRQGIGRTLLEEIERIAKEKGIIGIVLGTDDEQFRTSLSQVTISRDNIWEEIKKIRNLRNHPYEFYEKCGYMIVGIVPNANGKNRPDIWMWKALE